MLPWRGMNLVGTTDELISGDPADASVEAADVEHLVTRIVRLLPASRPALQSIAASYAGVRALPGSSADTYAMSRDGVCADHRTDGAAGFLSVFGGKWTTARVMAEAAVDRIAEALGKPLRPCDTATAALEDAPDQPVSAFEQGWRERLPAWGEADVADWVAAYGRSLPAVLRHLPDGHRADSGTLEAARFAHAADAEMAVTSQDLTRRLARWYGVRHPGVAERASEWLAGKRKVTDARA